MSRGFQISAITHGDASVTPIREEPGTGSPKRPPSRPVAKHVLSWAG